MVSNSLKKYKINLDEILLMNKININKKDFEDFCNAYSFFDWQKEYLWHLLTTDRQYFVPPFSRYEKYYFSTIHAMSKLLIEDNNEKEE